MTFTLCQMPSDGVSTLGFTACLVACLNVGILNPGAHLVPGYSEAAVVASCCAMCLCFDENSTVEGEFGTVLLKEVSPGDRVQTLRSDGSVTYTEVVNAYVSTRDSGFDALEAILADGRKIVATRSQPFPVLRGGTEVVLEGGQLARGDILMTSGGTSEVASLM